MAPDSQNTPSNDWDTTIKSSLVSIGTHSLFLSVSGPSRQPGEPLVIAFPGAGEPSSAFIAVEKLIARFARLLLYDRSGLGQSEDAPNHASAATAANELNVALKEVGISAPFILLAHSYGAIVAREFLHLRSDDVIGMVLAEASTERQSQFFRIPDPNMVALLHGLNVAEVTGLKADCKLTPEEWRTRAKQIRRGAVASQAEGASLQQVCETLGVKKQFERRAMGDKPVSVIRCNPARDYRRLYEKGVEIGNGTEAQREAFRQLLSNWDAIAKDLAEEQLQLSSNSRLAYIPDCGHNINLTHPDIIEREIRWVLDNLSRERGQSSL